MKIDRDQVKIIPQETLLLRLEQSEDLREFTIQMWLQNPQLARQGGARVVEIMTPLDELTAMTEKRGIDLTAQTKETDARILIDDQLRAAGWNPRCIRNRKAASQSMACGGSSRRKS